MEIDIKYIAPYLPYDLNLEEKYFSKKHNEEIVNYLILDKDNFTYFYPNNQIKPILRPLSDLAYLIYNQESKELKTQEDTLIYWSSRNYIDFDEIPYNDVKWLLSNHFDIFGLIEQGLAIDINDLPNI